MSLNKLFIAAALIAGTSAATVAAHANPVSIGVSGVNSPNVTVLDAGFGSAGVTGDTFSNYTVSLSATGSPALINPNFGSNTLTIRSSSAGTIMLYATETNDNVLVPSFNLGLSNNPLSDTNVTESVYMSASNVAFAETTLLGSATLSPGVTDSINSAVGTTSSPFSITEVYQITFGNRGGTVDATILEKANVPEPMSMSILGAGLAGLGFIRLRRKA